MTVTDRTPSLDENEPGWAQEPDIPRFGAEENDLDEPAGPSAYDLAADRYCAAVLAWPRAKAEAERIVRAAEAEYEAADADLARYETRRGIPLPEFR